MAFYALRNEWHCVIFCPSNNAALSANLGDKIMRKLFIECASRSTAARRAPWAAVIMKVEGGFIAFESAEDYRVAKAQK